MKSRFSDRPSRGSPWVDSPPASVARPTKHRHYVARIKRLIAEYKARRDYANAELRFWRKELRRMGGGEGTP